MSERPVSCSSACPHLLAPLPADQARVATGILFILKPIIDSAAPILHTLQVHVAAGQPVELAAQGAGAEQLAAAPVHLGQELEPLELLLRDESGAPSCTCGCQPVAAAGAAAPRRVGCAVLHLRLRCSAPAGAPSSPCKCPPAAAPSNTHGARPLSQHTNPHFVSSQIQLLFPTISVNLFQLRGSAAAAVAWR